MSFEESNMQRSICKDYCYRLIRGNVSSDDNISLSKLELVVFDMDGVLTDVDSSWKYVHDFFNTSNEKSVEDYLRGRIDDVEFIRRDVNVWGVDGKLIKKSLLVSILDDIPLMKGARDVVSFLKMNNVKTGIVSAGIDVLADRVARELGIDFVCANGIRVDGDGFLTGEGVLGVRLIYKDDAVRRLSLESGVSLNGIVAVGNSCFDIPMFEVAGLGVAFNPEDDCVRRAADFVVEGRDLRGVIPLLKRYL